MNTTPNLEKNRITMITKAGVYFNLGSHKDASPAYVNTNCKNTVNSLYQELNQTVA